MVAKLIALLNRSLKLIRKAVKKKMETLLDVKSAAKILAVSPYTVRSYIRQGKLLPVRIGRLVRLDEEELSKFVRSNKVSGQQLGDEQ